MNAYDYSLATAGTPQITSPEADVRPRALRVLFLIRSLGRGGAERQLTTLAIALQQAGWDVTVACFYSGGTFQSLLDLAGVPVIDLHKRGRWDAAGFLWRLWRTLRAEDADVVHGYLTVGNLLALLARLAHPHTRIVWGVRSSFIDRTRYDWLSRLTFRASRRCARRADAIVVNSWAGAAHHTALGYPRASVRVVPNGIDTQHFRFDAAGRERLRKAWAVPDAARLVGVVGRLDPMKDHPTFLKAARILAAQDPRWRFVCVGDGRTGYARSLARLVDALGLAGRVIWAGARTDMPAVYSALDIAASTSYGEGFPNTVAEAMACSRTCVVTDVGDSARIVGPCGAVVAPRDPAALAAALADADKLLRQTDGSACLNAPARARIVETYSIEALVRNTEAVLHAACAARVRAGRA